MVLVARESFEPSLMGSQLAVLPMRFDYFVPILYRRSGRGGIFGFPDVLFSVTYGAATPVERTIPSLATTLSTTCRSISPRFHSNWCKGIRLFGGAG